MKNDTVACAKALIGMDLLLHQEILGTIVETEAYLFPDDAASHSFHGRRTPKNESMYLPEGHWYVYSGYGHPMLNLVTRPEGFAEAVLIRALELPARSGEIIANGPGKLTRYAGIDKRFDGQALGELSLRLGKRPIEIASRPRIGIDTVPEPWKSAALGFYAAGNPNVSRIRKRDVRDRVWL